MATKGTRGTRGKRGKDDYEDDNDNGDAEGHGMPCPNKMKMDVTAVVVARGGSVRLPGKALLPFGDGLSLVGHKCRQLARCNLVSRVVVGSDSEAILAEGVKQGAEAVRNDGAYASSNAMLEDMARRVAGDVVLWAHPTNPLVSTGTYDRALRAFAQGLLAGFDSLLSVQEVRRHAWMRGKPLNYDPAKRPHTLAAGCEPVFFQDGAIFVQGREEMARNGYFFGAWPQLFVMPEEEVCDIDVEQDYRDALRRAECLH